MNQEQQSDGTKKQWEKPRVSNLSVTDTNTGSGGASSDATNYGPGTATNTS